MIDIGRIQPVTEFVRNYRATLTRLRATGRPEVLTVNGKPECVLLDPKSYQKIQQALEEARFIEAVQEGIADMEAGRGLPLDEAFEEIQASLQSIQPEEI